MHALLMRRGASKRFPRRVGGAPAHRTIPRTEVLEARIALSSGPGAVLGGGPGAPFSSGNWSEYNYNAAGTRDNTAEKILSPSNVSGLHQLWDFKTAGVVNGTPAVVNNVVYAGDTTGMFYAVSADTGKLLWETQLNGSVTASALVTDNTVIIGTHGGNTPTGQPGAIYGLDARTGAIQWETTPQPNDPLSQIWGSATLVGRNVAIGVASGDELVFVNGTQVTPTSRGSLVLLDPQSGHIIWQTYTVSNADYANGATGAAIWSTPAYDPALGLIYAGTGNNYTSPATNTSDAVIAFNAQTGQMVWVNQRTMNDTWDNTFNSTAPDYDFGDSPHIYTLPSGETVVAAGQKSGFFWVFDAKTGNVLNVQSNGKVGLDLVPGGYLGGLFATAAVDPQTGVVFANANDAPPPGNPTQGTGDLFAIAGNGTHVLWQFPTPRGNLSGVALANGVVYFTSLNGTMYALDEATGALLTQVNTGSSASGPAVSNGRIFLGQGYAFGGPSATGGITAFGLATPHPTRSPYAQTNLVSDIAGMAQATDPNLINPWGVALSSTSPFWISNQGTNTATVYSATSSGVSVVPLTVNIPTTAAGPQGPTGQVFNNTSSFLVNGSPAAFIFDGLNGVISAWNATLGFAPGTTAQTEVTTPDTLYTGLALATIPSGSLAGSYLYAAGSTFQGQGQIDVFNGSFTNVTSPTFAGQFVDPNLPSGLVPFNVTLVDSGPYSGDLFVTYAPAGHAAQTAATPGQGAVAVFTTSGDFVKQLISGGPLAAPWGVTMAPAGFGAFSGDLLVGNFAYNDSVINAFDPRTGQFLGTLTDTSGRPIFNQGLWTLTFGNGGKGGSPATLYFTAGIDGETHGLFGSIQPIAPLPPHHPGPPPAPPHHPGPFGHPPFPLMARNAAAVDHYFQTIRDGALNSIFSNRNGFRSHKKER